MFQIKLSVKGYQGARPVVVVVVVVIVVVVIVVVAVVVVVLFQENIVSVTC